METVSSVDATIEKKVVIRRHKGELKREIMLGK